MGNKISSIIIALVYIALGILFIVMPQGVEEALCYVLAVAVAIFGLLYLLGYLVWSSSEDGPSSSGFVIGILMIMLAIFIMVKQDLIITLVPFLFGVMVLIRGLFTVETAFRIRRMGFPMGMPLIMGIVIMAFGLFIMLFPMEMGEALFILIGAGLLAAGIAGIIEEIFVRSSHSRRAHEVERARDMAPAVTTYEADEVEEVEEAEVIDPADTPAADEAAGAPVADEATGAPEAAQKKTAEEVSPAAVEADSSDQ